VHLGTSGYGFSVSGYQLWRPETGGELRQRVLPDGVSLIASREGRPLELTSDAPQEPQLVCYASGELTPFEARIELDRDTAWVVTGEVDGTLVGHAPEGPMR
jgi:general secretion pathway protein H